MAWNATKNRTIKKSITNALFGYLKDTNPNKVFKCYLCLPSTKAKDVKEALRQGVIDKNTKIIAIEKEHEHLRQMKVNLTRLGFGPKSRVVIHKDLCEIDEYDLELVCKRLGVDGVDLFYIDTCDCLIDCLQQWIKNVAGHIKTKDAVIATNVQGARAVWDLEKYVKKGNYINSVHNKNKWASPIAHCLAEMTDMLTGFVVGYKEAGTASPMVLCVNGYSCSNDELIENIWKVGFYQNLGYAK